MALLYSTERFIALRVLIIVGIELFNMFERGHFLTHALKIEGDDLYKDISSPILKGAKFFSYTLENLPLEFPNKYGFPAVFGMGSMSEAERALWTHRIKATEMRSCSSGNFYPEFSRALRDVDCEHGVGGVGHETPDYEYVLKNGLRSIYESVDGDTDFDRAVAESLFAVRNFAVRNGTTVPWEPARSFDEAINSIWILFVCTVISERTIYSFSWGRMDQYLLPYCDGISDEVLLKKFVDFFSMLNEVPPKFCDPASALNIGGADGFNRLSRIIIEAMAIVKKPIPLLAARISEGLSADDFELLLRRELLECGQPAFYGEESCRAALKRRGVAERYIDRWVANSCMSLFIPGVEWQDTWGVIMLMPRALELALNGGKVFNGREPLPLNVLPEALDNYKNFELFYAKVLEYLKAMLAILVNGERDGASRRCKSFQNPFLSALRPECMRRKREFRDGGADFTTIVIETFGLVNLADSLFTISELIFEKGRYSLEELVGAMKDNFGDASEMLSEIRHLPKYGQCESLPMAMMERLSGDVASIIEGLSTETSLCVPSLHTFYHHIIYGEKLPAYADGRLAGEPLAKNAGTSPAVMAPHTSLVLDATSFDQAHYSGGQALDLWIDPNEWESEAGRRRYIALFQTYFRRGGLQLQVNGASITDLEAAMMNPENYEHLYIKLGGFSEQFVSLERSLQEDYLRRFAKGM